MLLLVLPSLVAGLDPESKIDGKFWYTDPAGLVFLELVYDIMSWYTPLYPAQILNVGCALKQA